jgi:CDP-6-deoxy-D-xylo-4-hexulose-3-dehydrase
MSKDLERIKDLVKEYFASLEQSDKEFVPGKTEIPLAIPSYGWEEVSEAIGVMLSRWVLMGERVRAFENLFAEYIGIKNAVMVNSGSSANLLAMSILTNPALKSRIKQGAEVITPAVTWATTVFPIANIGAKPVLVDVELETYTIDPMEVEKAITKKTRVIMPVHLLGYPCDMKRIMEIAQEYNLYVVEDACEAHGAECYGKKVGSFADMATFSFYASHHITTMEGGMVVTNDDEYFELAKALRSNGWIRDLRNKEQIVKEYPEIDPRFLFVNLGFNMRPTELQGAFGIYQIKKLDQFIEVRRRNAQYWNKRLSEYSEYFILPKEREGFRHVYFGYPITIKPGAPFNRSGLTAYLEQKGIATRPVMAGNIAEQPAMKLVKYRKIGDLKNSRIIMRNSFFFGNHHGIDKIRREYVADCIAEFVEKKLWLKL